MTARDRRRGELTRPQAVLFYAALIALLLLVVWPGFGALREYLWLPVLTAVVGDSPVAGVVVTAGIYLLPTVALTVLVALRMGRRIRGWRWGAVAAVVLVPAVTMQSWRRSSGREELYEQISSHVDLRIVADAIDRGLGIGVTGLFVWAAVSYLTVMVQEWRLHPPARPSPRVYLLVTLLLMGVYWTVNLVITVDLALSVPIEEPWTRHYWPADAPG